MGEVHKFDPTLPVTPMMTLGNLFSDSVSQRRFSTFLLGIFAGLALNPAKCGNSSSAAEPDSRLPA
jgi:hypothetical protein